MAKIIPSNGNGVMYVFESKEEAIEAAQKQNDFIKKYFPEMKLKTSQMLIDKDYRLEFNESQQHFHLDNFTHEEGTHGWETIATDKDSKLEVFIDYMDKRYSYSKEKRVLTLKIVLKEWELYNFIYSGIEKFNRIFAKSDPEPIDVIKNSRLSPLDSIRLKIRENE
jgi:hypothetical protein